MAAVQALDDLQPKTNDGVTHQLLVDVGQAAGTRPALACKERPAEPPLVSISAFGKDA